MKRIHITGWLYYDVDDDDGWMKFGFHVADRQTGELLIEAGKELSPKTQGRLYSRIRWAQEASPDDLQLWAAEQALTQQSVYHHLKWHRGEGLQ